jgi:hypothetical protein
VMLEGVWNQPQLLVEKDSLLDGLISSSGKAIKVSQHTYRVTFQNALPGVRSAISLDAAVNFPGPGSPAWQEWLHAADVMGCSGGLDRTWRRLTSSSSMLAVAQVVDTTMRGCHRRIEAHPRRVALCRRRNAGYWGTISAQSPSVQAETTPFRPRRLRFARIFDVGNNIDIYNGLAYVNTSNVTAVQKTIGGAQILYVDTALRCGWQRPALRRAGLRRSGVRVWLPYWNNFSATGTHDRHRSHTAGQQLHPVQRCRRRRVVADASAVPARPSTRWFTRSASIP